MTSEPVGNPIEHRILPQRYRPALSRHTVLWKTLITLAASAMLGVSAIAPNAALAFGPPPPPPTLGGLPPGLGGRFLSSTPHWWWSSSPVALEVHSLALAPVVLFLISVAPLAHRTLVAGFSVIFRAALRATATAGLQALATAVTGGGTAPMASISMAITALPIPMPMTGATTPTPPGDT